MNFHVKFQDFPGLLTALLSSSSVAAYVCTLEYFGCVSRPFHFPIFTAAMLLRVVILPPSPQLLRR